MKKAILTSILRGSQLAFLGATIGFQSQAVDFKVFGTNEPAMDFHGFASQGYIYNTGNNNYLGGKSSEGTFDFREYGVNASIAKGKWRVGAQLFGQKLGAYGEDKITLDWATVDYQASQYIGLRVGRVKTPRGLYNEALDLDFTRPFVLLPQSVYDARLRDFNSSFDGGMFYGNIPMGKAGSLDYRAYAGHISLSTQSGANDYFNNDAALVNKSFTMDATFGGSLFWNTPVEGLRFGYSFQGFKGFSADRFVNFGPVPIIGTRATDLYQRHLLSGEYTMGKWAFAAEGGVDTAKYSIWFPTLPIFGRSPENFQEVYAYVSATRQITKKLSMGAYYSYSDDSLKFPTHFIPDTDLPQTDIALAARYDFTDYLLGKIEVHYLDGSGKLFDTAAMSQPISKRENQWMMIDAKLTFYF